MTCSSLAPPFICSRMLLRRSTASSALESASVWFWQTRQRSSEESVMTRFSMTVSSAAKRETVRIDRTAKSSLFTAELAHERHDLLRRNLLRDGADALVADHALLVDHIGFGDAVDAVVDADATRAVVDGKQERIAI